MAANGYGPSPVTGHVGRIPNYGKTQVNPMGGIEPPACIQNAMMTKDKKPFTYTPGGLDLSQIKTPSMARRMARQRSMEEHEQAYAQQQPNNTYHPQGGPVPPPPPPPKIPAPPPPPPLIIEAPKTKSPKPIAPGERPEIVIPENPIGMLRKTNSPYHWEAEKADMQRMGPVPKFVDKVPSPLTVKLPSHNNSQNYYPQNNAQRPNYSYGNHNQAPDSPLHRPEAQYANQTSPNVNGSPHTRDILLRQDSQFNKSPQPYGNQSPIIQSPATTGSPYSPNPNNHWKQPARRDSPVRVNSISPQSPQQNRAPFSPVVKQNVPSYNQTVPSHSTFHTLPRAGQRNQDTFSNNQGNYNNSISNNIRDTQPSQNIENTAPWRSSTLNRHLRDTQNFNNQNINQEQAYIPPWKVNDTNNNQVENNCNPVWKQDNKNTTNQVNNQQQYSPPWAAQETSNKRGQDTAPWRSPEHTPRSVAPTTPPENRYQSSISIPVTPRKQNTQPEYNNNTQKEAVYVNQEPIYYCPDSPKTIPPWVKTQKEKTKTPPPVWCQRPLDGRKSSSRELATPPRDTNQEPEWVKKSNEIQQGAREVVSPPKYQQPVQPNWSTRPSENRKSLPRDNAQGRIIPIQMEVSSTETRNQGRHEGNQPQLRIIIDMKQNPDARGQNAQVPFSQPTQRIMRVLSPQLVRMDEPSQNQPDLPALNRSFQSSQDSQPKTRIIPIQIEGGNGGANKSVYYHKFTKNGSPRQSKAFKVLQVITGTGDNIEKNLEDRHGYSDL